MARKKSSIDGHEHETAGHIQTKIPLLKSKQLLDKVMECAQNAIFIIDAGTTEILDCSPSASKMFGYPINEMLNKKTNFLHVNTSTLEDFRNQLYAAISKNDFLYLPRFKMKRKDGTIFPTEHSVVPFKDSKGNITAWVSVVRDNSERELSENALKESEQRYRMLVETMREAFGIMDENNKITYVNDRALELTGYTREELLGQSVLKLLDEPNQEILSKEQEKIGRNDRGSYEITWTGKGGQQIHTILSPKDIFNADGTYKGTFAVITDITELKNTMSELQDKKNLLQEKTDHLEEMNTALKVLLDKRELDKKELEEKVLSNLNQLVVPYLEKLKNDTLNQGQKNLLDIIESNLNELVSAFTHTVSIKLLTKFTPTEIQVANFIRQGKRTKEIAEILCLSPKTVDFHRDNIRKKIGIKNKKQNLRSLLLSFK